MTEEQLAALLRLKRYEQPPPGYFDGLLRDIQRRQRAELLRKPLWRIGLERVQTFFGEHSMGGLSYGGAMAGLLIAGLGGITLLTPDKPQPARQTAQVVAAKPSAPVSLPLQPPSPGADPSLGTQSFSTAPSGREVSPFPRYIIDARPASYEPSFQF